MDLQDAAQLNATTPVIRCKCSMNLPGMHRGWVTCAGVNVTSIRVPGCRTDSHQSSSTTVCTPALANHFASPSGTYLRATHRHYTSSRPCRAMQQDMISWPEISASSGVQGGSSSRRPVHSIQQAGSFEDITMRGMSSANCRRHLEKRAGRAADTTECNITLAQSCDCVQTLRSPTRNDLR